VEGGKLIWQPQANHFDTPSSMIGACIFSIPTFFSIDEDGPLTLMANGMLIAITVISTNSNLKEEIGSGKDLAFVSVVSGISSWIGYHLYYYDKKFYESDNYYLFNSENNSKHLQSHVSSKVQSEEHTKVNDANPKISDIDWINAIYQNVSSISNIIKVSPSLLEYKNMACFKEECPALERNCIHENKEKCLSG